MSATLPPAQGINGLGTGKSNLDMEGNATIFNNAAVLVSAGAAVSALCALLAFLFSRKMSRQDMIDLLKIEILQVVFSVQGREIWGKTVQLSKIQTGGIGAQTKDLASLLRDKHTSPSKFQPKFKLKSKYEKDKWL